MPPKQEQFETLKYNTLPRTMPRSLSPIHRAKTAHRSRSRFLSLLLLPDDEHIDDGVDDAEKDDAKALRARRCCRCHHSHEQKCSSSSSFSSRFSPRTRRARRSPLPLLLPLGTTFFFVEKRRERERERERERVRCSLFFLLFVWKKWTCFFFKFSVFYCFFGEGRRRGRAPPSKQQKFLCTPLSSLLLDFLILRPNKNDALGAKVCIVSSSSSSSFTSSSSFSEGKLALVETNREKREEDILSRDAWSPRVRFRSRRPRRPRRRRVDFSRRRQHRRRRHRRDVRITRPPVHFRARVGAATITTKKNEKVSAPRRIFYITAVERSATTTTTTTIIITRREREEDV